MKTYTREEINDILNRISSMNYVYEIKSDGDNFFFKRIYKRTKNGVFQYYMIRTLYIVCECDKNNYTDMCHITSFNLNNVSNVIDHSPSTISIYIENEKYSQLFFSDKRIRYIRNNILSFLRRLFHSRKK